MVVMQCSLSGWSLHVLPVLMWVPTGYYSFLPLCKGSNSKLPSGLAPEGRIDSCPFPDRYWDVTITISLLQKMTKEEKRNKKKTNIASAGMLRNDDLLKPCSLFIHNEKSSSTALTTDSWSGHILISPFHQLQELCLHFISQVTVASIDQRFPNS